MAATRHNTICSEDKMSSERRSSGSKDHIKETKVADSGLLSLFMCSNEGARHGHQCHMDTFLVMYSFRSHLNLSAMPN